MVLKKELTPETFLSVPRRPVVVPNSDGTLGLYTVSTHEFGKGTRKKWKVMELASGATYQLTDDDKIHDANWLPNSERTVVWLRSGEKGVTSLAVTELTGGQWAGESHVAAKISAPIQALRVKGLDDGSVAFAVVGLSSDDGRIYTRRVRKISARTYDDVRVREVCTTCP